LNATKVVDVGSCDAAVAYILAQPADPQSVLEVVRNDAQIIHSYVWKPASKIWALRGSRYDQAADTLHNMLKGMR